MLSPDGGIGDHQQHRIAGDAQEVGRDDLDPPSLNAVASPFRSMVATLISELFQLTWLVTSCDELSLKVAMAWNCSLVPWAGSCRRRYDLQRSGDGIGDSQGRTAADGAKGGGDGRLTNAAPRDQSQAIDTRR